MGAAVMHCCKARQVRSQPDPAPKDSWRRRRLFVEGKDLT
jgi:hypothetical protein